MSPQAEPLFDDLDEETPVVAPTVEEGGSALPAGTDVPGGQLTPEQLMAAATGASSPQGDAVDRLLAANPDAAGSQAPLLPGAAPVGPGAPGAVPSALPGAAAGPVANGPVVPPGSPVAAPGSPQAAETALIPGMNANAIQGEDALRREGAAKVGMAQADADAARAAAPILEQAAQDQTQIVEQGNRATQAWMDKAQQYTQQYQQLGYHDFWADKGTGNKVLAGIAMLFGANTGRAENPGLQIINQAIDRDFRQQQAAIEKAGKNAEMAQGQARFGLSVTQERLAQNELKKAAALDAAAGKALSLKLQQGVPLAQAQNDQAIVALRQQAAQTRMGVFQAVHKQNMEDAKLAIDQERADALMLRAQKYKGKGAGGAGGGRAPAYQKFVDAIGQVPPGQPVPGSVAALGIQAGIKPGQIGAEIDRIRESSAKLAKLSGAGGGTGAGSVRQNAVLGNLAEAEKAAKDIKVGGVSPETIAKLQSNEERAHAAHHAAESGALGSLTAGAMRTFGIAPRGRYDGIPEEEQKRITAAEQVITHLTEMQQGKNIETLEQYRERYSPYIPGLSPEEVRRREKALPGLVAEQRAIQDPQGVGTKRQAAAGEGSDVAKKIAAKVKASQDVLNDPKKSALLAPLERAKLMKFVRENKPPASNGMSPMNDLTL